MTDVSLQLNAWTENPGNEVFCVQGEQNSRTLSITLIDRTGNESGPLAVAKQTPRYLDLTGYTARMYVEKKDDTSVYFDGTVTDAKNGKVEFTLPAQAVTLSGNVPCTIELSNGSAELKVIGIILNVQKSSLEDSVESSDDFSTLQTVIERAETAIEECESAAEGVNEAKDAANTAAAEANAAKDAANSAATEANDAASEANAQAQAALQSSVLATQATGAANTAADRANEAAEAVEGLDVSQLVQQIKQLTPEFLKVWDCPDGDARLELWAAASGGMVEYYAVLNGTFSKDSYSNDTLSGSGDGEMVDLFDADPKFLPELSDTADGAQSATFNGIIGVKDSKMARINLALIHSEGASVQTVGADLTGYTLLNLGNVIPLGRVKSQSYQG